MGRCRRVYCRFPFLSLGFLDLHSSPCQASQETEWKRMGDENDVKISKPWDTNSLPKLPNKEWNARQKLLITVWHPGLISGKHQQSQRTRPPDEGKEHRSQRFLSQLQRNEMEAARRETQGISGIDPYRSTCLFPCCRANRRLMSTKRLEGWQCRSDLWQGVLCWKARESSGEPQTSRNTDRLVELKQRFQK